MPYNSITDKPYHGMNVVWLLAVAQECGYTDPRWMIYRQAQEQGAQVRRGEKGTAIQYWKWQGLEPVLDAAGQPVIGDDGRPQQEMVQYTRPRVWSAVVFNAAQIDGLAPAPTRSPVPDWERHEQAERLLHAGNPTIQYGGDRAAYNRRADWIVLPQRAQFATADAFYAVALHGKAHWTGHPSRLNRDLAHPFGSDGYAREELRAEIASLMLGEQLGIGHDPVPGQHAAYIQSWIRLLKDDPREIFRAAAEAEKIVTYVHGLAPQQQQDAAPALRSTPALAPDNPAVWMPDPLIEQALTWQAQDNRRSDLPLAEALRQGQPDRALILLEDRPEATPLRQVIADQWRQWREANRVGWGITPHDLHRFPNLSQANVQAAPGDLSAPANTVQIKMPVLMTEPEAVAMQTRTEPVILAVPYAEKDEAKRLGARWDRENKVWYAPAGVELTPLERWLPAITPLHLESARDPRLEFASALREAGFLLDGQPAMDGQLRRVRVDGDRPGERSGAYVGYLDGHPAGYLKNHRTGMERTWKATGRPSLLSARDRAQLNAEAAQRRQARAEERERQYEQAAQKAEMQWATATPVEQHPHLTAKGVPSYGLRQDEDGNLLVPVHDADGKLWSLQTIDASGRKSFQKEGRVHGGHFLIGDPATDSAILIAEGYATAATVHRATGLPVVVAFNAGNFSAVAEAYRERYPHKRLYIAGDNDHQQERQGKPNVGREKAEEAAQRVGGFALLPTLAAADTGSDWNDVEKVQGLTAVRQQLQAGLTSAEWRRRVDEQKKARAVQPPARQPVASEAARHLEEPQKRSRGRRW